MNNIYWKKRIAICIVLTIMMPLFFQSGLIVPVYADDREVIETNSNINNEQTISSTISASNIMKNGNVIFTPERLDGEKLFAAGYEYGDILLVSFLDHSLELPLCGDIRDVFLGESLIYAKNNYVILGINGREFAAVYGIATKTVDGNNKVSWTLTGGLEEISVKISIREKGAYKIYPLDYTDIRENYPNLSDEQFANFRTVTTTGMGRGVLHRSASPINPQHGRNKYADEAIRKAGVNVIMNLADDEDTAREREGFEDTYYSKQKFIALNLGVDFLSEDFREGLAKGIRFFAANPGIYEVHCTEGKDRAGFVCAILECLMGAGYDEVIRDYMVSFFNYYGVTEGDARYQRIVDGNIVKFLQNAFGVDDLKSVDLSAEATEYLRQIGVSDEDIRLLKANLSVSKNDDTEGRVPITEPGSKYASSKDNFAPIATSGKIKKLKLDFSNVAKSNVKPSDLKMTAVKGSKFTTVAKVAEGGKVSGSGGVKVKVNKKTRVASINCKSTGAATLPMEDGTTYTITFTVQKPKANKAVKQLSVGGGEKSFTVKDLFGTDIDAGELSIGKQKHTQAKIVGNSLTINPTETDRIRLVYKYLNKKYRITIKVSRCL